MSPDRLSNPSPGLPLDPLEPLILVKKSIALHLIRALEGLIHTLEGTIFEPWSALSKLSRALSKPPRALIEAHKSLLFKAFQGASASLWRASKALDKISKGLRCVFEPNLNDVKYH